MAAQSMAAKIILANLAIIPTRAILLLLPVSLFIDTVVGRCKRAMILVQGESGPDRPALPSRSYFSGMFLSC
jgi:hypothetical protein